jgi:hypothetical protein
MQDRSSHPPSTFTATSAASSVAPICTAGWVDTCEGAATSAKRRRERYRQRQTLVRHLFFVEQWPTRLIAGQLKVSPGYITRVIIRASRLDAKVVP